MPIGLSLPPLPFSWDWLPPTACLVGGAVRDALLARQQAYLDLDFVLPELAVETAKRIAERYGAGFVILDKVRRIARVVFPAGTVDFAQQEGGNLAADLRRRDFTANAIAYNPQTGELIDPLQGLADLKRQQLRMVSPANLEDDPLRLLRAYRQAAQLQFTIEPQTRSAIQQLAPLLSQVAAERVQTEIGYLLENAGGSYWLAEAWRDGLLSFWFPSATAANFQQVAGVDSAARRLTAALSPREPEAALANSPFRPAIPLAKLACLVAPTPSEAESELSKLKYSRQEIRAVVSAVKNLPRLQAKELLTSLREQYFFFLEVGNFLPILALLAVAKEKDWETVLFLVKRYFDAGDSVAHPHPLVTGRELIQHLGLSPSPLIGKLLTEIQIAYIEGKISTPEEAIEFGKEHLDWLLR
jgi:tRNA nucleotidyltransferase (CCA-adding enzyme)